MIGIAVYSFIIAYLEIEYWKLSENSHIKNIPVMHSLLGFAISMLLVFRTNTAYDRWWEGRRLWGMLVNNSRNLALKIGAFIPHEDVAQRAFFARIIPAYALSLHNHLRTKKLQMELFEDDEHNHEIFKTIDHSRHVPNQLASLMYRHVQDLYKRQVITGEQLIVLNNELASFTDICGACERIKNTPIPYSYTVFIKKFIFIYIMTLPFGFVFSLGYIVIPVVVFIFYVLASLELIAEEIEDPFGEDANDVPTEKISENIKNSIREIL